MSFIRHRRATSPNKFECRNVYSTNRRNFDYKLGTLEYRSVRFETETLDKSNFQGNAAVNYTDRETPWTRIIEHKWFEFGKDENGNELPKTIISREYSSEWKTGDEPYYPVNDAKNAIYTQFEMKTINALIV